MIEDRLGEKIGELADTTRGRFEEIFDRNARVERAVASLLDVVQELAEGLAHGQTPETDWSEIVVDTFGKHRADLRGEIVEWDGDDGDV